ncbi:PREDICTED: huntingtin-interacting protein M-like [Chinchilla lanigera]|uniref:huntingtin-interacting protein M-like n=1 Tax=Chinchilla lanigera TaxID=34839 RepID=UPI0006980693|nr:PREDICTED: huntingtin-interacting protein M-like [Chinchilla lanigera]
MREEMGIQCAGLRASGFRDLVQLVKCQGRPERKLAAIMCEETNQGGPYEDSTEQEDPASSPEEQFPVAHIFCILPEEYNPALSSNTYDFLHAMVDSLTEYVLMLVRSEGNNNVGRPANPQDREREADNNRESPPIILNVSFSFSDEAPGPRRNG